MAIPAKCQHFDARIKALRARQQALAQTLGKSGAGKQQVLDEIRDIGTRIAEVQQDLNACIVGNTPIPNAPSLSIVRIDVLQCVSDPGTDLITNKRTAVRVFVSSGLPGGPPFPDGTGVVGGIDGQLEVQVLGVGQPVVLQPLNAPVFANPLRAINPSRIDHALLYELPLSLTDAALIKLSATVMIRAQPNTQVASSAFASFGPQLRQKIVPFLLADAFQGHPAPSMNDFRFSLEKTIARMPLAENGFIVKPPLIGTVSDDLTTYIAWTNLLLGLMTLIAVFGHDIDGLHAAMVPNGNSYAWNGLASPRVLIAAPALVSKPASGALFAHEFAHTFGINHAGCPAEGQPNAPAFIDTTLATRLSFYGIDMSHSPHPDLKPVGTYTLMTYCGGEEKWPDGTIWKHIRVRVPN